MSSLLPNPELNTLVSACPFCRGEGQLMERWTTTQGEKSGMRGSKRLFFFYECVICGARGGSAETKEIALMSWNSRPTNVWQPLPAAGASVLLPGGQKFGHLLVLEQGRIKLLDYIEQELTQDGSGVQAEQDVDLGPFRVCALRPGYEGRMKGTAHAVAGFFGPRDEA